LAPTGLVGMDWAWGSSMMALEVDDNRPPAAIALVCINLRREKPSGIVASNHSRETTENSYPELNPAFIV
jgi:hypothetical protein